MRRRSFLLLTAATAWADVEQELSDLVAAMASGLSEGNAAAFLKTVDASLPGYESFAANVRGLVAQNALSSSIEIVKQDGDNRGRNLELDWLLEITGTDGSRNFVRRQDTVKVRLERRKGRWRVTAIEPRGFFAPPGVAPAK
ncbi:MAG TPA: hypothetical protein VL285_00315 [Bryobacteraceae bacterium]|nr:hypothetical protein [Bryobacteraceae bacterium]